MELESFFLLTDPGSHHAVVLRLRQLLTKREDREKVEIAFRTLYYLTNPEPGKPRYLEFSWETIETCIELYYKKTICHEALLRKRNISEHQRLLARSVT
jgi:hypothetical protein